MKQMDIVKNNKTTLKKNLTESEIEILFNSIMNIAYELENTNIDEVCLNKYLNKAYETITK